MIPPLPFTRGDFEGFVAAFINNLVQLLILAPLCIFVVGLSPELVYGRILPGVAISFLVGNLYYAWLAVKLAREEGRKDVCALPYGISTPGLIAHVFLVMLPAKQLAIAQGLADPSRVAWQAGLVACLVGGLIEFAAAFVSEPIRRVTPAAAMLATLGGIGIGFLGLSFLFQIYAAPIVGLTTLALVFVIYFGRVRFGNKLPGTLLVLIVGTGLAWVTGIAPVGGGAAEPLRHLGLYLPTPALADLWTGLSGGHILPYLSIILPIGLLGALASLQNIESAEAAGDAYRPRPCLIANSFGTIGASFFGSPFPTSIYIGHPAWKRMGARAGYSVLNGAFMLVVCLTGTMGVLAWAIPAEAGIAIILWVGIIICAQAYEVVPKRYIPAVVVGTLPGLAAWATLTVKSTLRGRHARVRRGPVRAAPGGGRQRQWCLSRWRLRPRDRLPVRRHDPGCNLCLHHRSPFPAGRLLEPRGRRPEPERIDARLPLRPRRHPGRPAADRPPGQALRGRLDRALSGLALRPGLYPGGAAPDRRRALRATRHHPRRGLMHP